MEANNSYCMRLLTNTFEILLFNKITIIHHFIKVTLKPERSIIIAFNPKSNNKGDVLGAL